MNQEEHDAEVLTLVEETRALIGEIHVLVAMFRAEGQHAKADRWLGAVALLHKELARTLNPFAPIISKN